jgi:hypothetical protein
VVDRAPLGQVICVYFGFPYQPNIPLIALFILTMEAIHSSETLVLTRATRLHIPEDGNLYSHRSENINLT